jgi:hypothetical protein
MRKAKEARSARKGVFFSNPLGPKNIPTKEYKRKGAGFGMMTRYSLIARLGPA